MNRVLVTGGTGVLGREVAARLIEAGAVVRVLSRGAKPAARATSLESATEWARADLATGAGLDAALSGVAVVVHAASSPFRRSRQVDADGTRRLLAAASRAGVQHLVYISIVGIDRNPYPYYRHKLAAEAAIAGGPVPWSILRATHFYALLDAFFQPLARLPAAPLPADFVFQPVDEAEVAEALAEAVAAGPSGRLTDMGGPELATVGALARAWLAARGRRCRLIGLPVPGQAAHAFRSGYNTCPQGRRGQLTWAAWLRRAYGIESAHSDSRNAVEGRAA